MNTGNLLETDLNMLDENLSNASKSSLSMISLKKQKSTKDTSAVVSNVPRLSAREVSRSSCRGLLSRIGLLSAHRRNYKKNRLKPEQDKSEPNNIYNSGEFDSSTCAHQVNRDSQVLGNSETFFSPSVEPNSNLLDPVLVSEQFADSPEASASRQRICRQKKNQDFVKKRFEGLADLNAGSNSTPLVDFKEISTTSRRLRHPMNEKVDAMRFDSCHGGQQSRSLLESSSHFATAVQLGSRHVEQNKCLSGNSSFSTPHILPAEVSPRGSGKGRRAHTSFTQLRVNSSTTGSSACQTLRDAKSVLRKHAPANAVSAASSTHVAINSVIGLSLHSFHPTNSFHSRSSSFRSRRACVWRGVMASDAEDSIHDKDSSTIGTTVVASFPPGVETSRHGIASQKTQYLANSTRTHEGSVDRSFRSFPKGPLDSACTPFSHTTSDIIASPSEQQANPNYTFGHALQSIVMVPGSDPSLGQIRSPRLTFEMLDTSSITSFNPEETTKDLSASDRSSSMGSVNGMPLRARIMGPKLVHHLSSRSAQSIDNSNTSDSDLEAEHQKKVDELLKLLTADHRPCRSNSLVPDDRLSRTSNNNTGNSGDMTTGGFVRVDGVASASHNTVNCTWDLITGSTETGVDPAANSSSEEKAIPNSSGWTCVGSLFSSHDWYMRMRRKKDDDGTENDEEFKSRGFDKSKVHNTNRCSCSGGSDSIALPSVSGDIETKSVLSSPRKLPLGDKSDTGKREKGLPFRGTSCTHATNQTDVRINNFEPSTNVEGRQSREGITFNSRSNRVCSSMDNSQKKQLQIQSTTPISLQNGLTAVPRSSSGSSAPLDDQKLPTKKNAHQTGCSVTPGESVKSNFYEVPILVHHECNLRVSPTGRESNPPLTPVSQKASNIPQTPVIVHAHEFHQVSSVTAPQLTTHNHQVNSSSNQHLPDTTCDHSNSTPKRISSASSQEKALKHSNKSTEQVRLEPVIVSTSKVKRIKKKTRQRPTVLPTTSNVRTNSVGKVNKSPLSKSYCIDGIPFSIQTTKDAFLPALPQDHPKIECNPTSSAASASETDHSVSPESTLLHSSYSSGNGKASQDFPPHCIQARRRTIPHCTNTSKMASLIDVSLKAGSDSHVLPLQREDSSTAQGNLLHITWPTGRNPTPILAQNVTSAEPDPCQKASLPQVKSAKLQPFGPFNKSRRIPASKSKLVSNGKLHPPSPGVVLPQWKPSDASKPFDTSKQVGTSRPVLSSASASKNVTSGQDADFNTGIRTRTSQTHCGANVDDQAVI